VRVYIYVPAGILSAVLLEFFILFRLKPKQNATGG
jgi:hypothetical protein